MLIFSFLESKEEGKDQESMQSNNAPDLGHHIWESDKNTKNITYKSAKKSALSEHVTTRLQGVDKTA